MIYEEGDAVVIVGGHWEGYIGTVEGYEGLSDRYTIDLGDYTIAAPKAEIAPVVFLSDDEEQDSPQGEAPPFGMSSEQLAQHVGEFIERCSSRVVGVGQEQYSEGEYQKFEAVPLEQLLDMLTEELQDAAVYAAMLDIRVQRFRQALEERT